MYKFLSKTKIPCTVESFNTFFQFLKNLIFESENVDKNKNLSC